ncbi:MAG: YggT family protein [Armatimonadota bacterium]
MMNHALWILYDAFCLLILASIILSWVPSLRWRPVGRLIYNVTEPILQPFRRLVGHVRLGGAYMDFSPTLAIVAGAIVVGLVTLLLKHLGMH